MDPYEKPNPTFNEILEEHEFYWIIPAHYYGTFEYLHSASGERYNILGQVWWKHVVSGKSGLSSKGLIKHIENNKNYQHSKIVKILKR